MLFLPVLCLAAFDPVADFFQDVKAIQHQYYRREMVRPATGSFSPWNWVLIGPEGGEIIGVAGHPNAAGLALALSLGDVWRTTDNGASWTVVLENCMPQQALLSTASRGIVVEAGGVVWFTLDAGANWSEVATFPDFQVASAEVPDTLVWLVEGDPPMLHVSTNSGLAWYPSGNIPIVNTVDRIDHWPAAPGLVWLAGHAAGDDSLVYILHSTDAGGSWTCLDTIVGGAVYDIARNPWDPNHTLLCTERGMYQATSADGPWTLLAEPLAFGVYQPADVEFTGNDTILLACLIEPGMFTAYQMFNTWIFSQRDSRESMISACLAQSSQFAASVGKGVFRSTNEGSSWTVCRTGLYANVLLGTGAASRIRDNVLEVASLGGTIWQTDDWGGVWDTLPRNFLIGSAIERAPTDPAIQYLSGLDVEVIPPSTIRFLTIFRSSDAGATWSEVDSTYMPGDLCVTTDPAVVLGVQDNTVIRSTAGGAGFAPVFVRGTSLSNLCGTDTVFVATADSTFVSFDRGATWTGLIGRGSDELAYDETRRILYLTGAPIYRYALSSGNLDSLVYYGAATAVAPNGSLYFMHYVSSESLYIARSFDGGLTIEQEYFPIPQLAGGLAAADSGLFDYQFARGMWVNRDIAHGIAEQEPGVLPGMLSVPSLCARTDRVRMTISAIGSAEVKVTLHDVLGRDLGTIYQGMPGPCLCLAFSPVHLSAGVYFVVARSAGLWQATKITVY